MSAGHDLADKRRFQIRMLDKVRGNMSLDVMDRNQRLLCCISDRLRSRNSDKIKLVTEANASRPVPQWLDADKNQLTAKVVRLPAREDVDMDIEEQQIVEFYSK